MSARIARGRRRLAGEGGFTMIVAVLVLMVVLLASAAAYSATIGDMRSGGYSEDQKQAFAAAEAGVEWYRSHLGQDSTYWTACTSPPGITNGPIPIENAPAGGGASVGPWRTVSASGTGPGPQYVIDLLPVAPATACDPNDPSGSMIDPTTGTFRIRVTGRARATAGAPRRSIVATFRRRGFLDFIYYTDLEDRDPDLWAAATVGSYESSHGLQSMTPDPVAWINANCSKHWWEGRSTARYSGTTTKTDGTAGVAVTNYDWCQTGDIQFADTDRVAGPFHSNDGLLVCNTPEFGRTAADAIEISAPQSLAYRAAGGCGANPTWTGTPQYGAEQMTLPPSNGSLAGQVTPGYFFTGKTTIVLNTSGTMSVTNAGIAGGSVTLAQPANGVVYVANGTCGVSYDPDNPYGDPAGCGDLEVSGTYTQSMTLTSEKDIVVKGPVMKSSNQLLGLISNNYVRVYHPVAAGCGANSVTLPNPFKIEAAILTVNHSFTVDNYACGSALGTLNVVGAIAQKYRGVVGTGNGSTGFIKDYQYDDRLKYRSPPNFLDPLQSGWKVVRESEQIPAS